MNKRKPRAMFYCSQATFDLIAEAAYLKDYTLDGWLNNKVVDMFKYTTAWLKQPTYEDFYPWKKEARQLPFLRGIKGYKERDRETRRLLRQEIEKSGLSINKFCQRYFTYHALRDLNKTLTLEELEDYRIRKQWGSEYVDRAIANWKEREGKK